MRLVVALSPLLFVVLPFVIGATVLAAAAGVAVPTPMKIAMRTVAVLSGLFLVLWVAVMVAASLAISHPVH